MSKLNLRCSSVVLSVVREVLGMVLGAYVLLFMVGLCDSTARQRNAGPVGIHLTRQPIIGVPERQRH